MKKTKLRLLVLVLFLGGLIILPQKAKAAEIIPVNISVKYGQTEAREIVDMINEARTNSEYAWYWNMDDTTKTYCTDLKELKYDYDLERVAITNVQWEGIPGASISKKILATIFLVKILLPAK